MNKYLVQIRNILAQMKYLRRLEVTRNDTAVYFMKSRNLTVQLG